MQQIYEDLLGFVWQYRKLPLSLKTTDEQQIEIFHPGQKNTDSGPDFFGAKVKIGETIWAGNIEFHVKTTDWVRHRHQNDPAYESVILHVVFEHDLPKHEMVQNIPILELKKYISKELIDRYYSLLSETTWIPCQNNLVHVEQITLKPWLHRIAIERLEHKTQQIREMLAVTRMDWETTFFHWFSSCFGFKLNNTGFLLLARSIPFKVLMKHQDNLFQTEALLFGQAGLLLNMFQDNYAKSLKKEYVFLAEKYGLTPIDPKVWKFMRTRPGNFPTIRISQLANILTRINSLLSEMFSDARHDKIKKLLSSETSEYWKNHYHFDKITEPEKTRQLGKLAIDNLIVNAIVPFVFLYGDFHGNQKFKDAAISMLEHILPEDNHIIKSWNKLNIIAENAAESQALIELFNNYCSLKKCLSCSIGASLLLDVN
jgi:hypothetical protein